MKVSVNITRKVDNSNFAFDFLVIPKPRIIPDIPETLYIGETYTIDTKLNQEEIQNSYTTINYGAEQKTYYDNILKLTPTLNPSAAVLRRAKPTVVRHLATGNCDSSQRAGWAKRVETHEAVIGGTRHE